MYNYILYTSMYAPKKYVYHADVIRGSLEDAQRSIRNEMKGDSDIIKGIIIARCETPLDKTEYKELVNIAIMNTIIE